MPRKILDEYAIRILIDCATNATSDKSAAEKYGVSRKSIGNYRRRLETDRAFAAYFATKLEQAQDDWIKDVPSCIKAGIEFLQKSCQQADCTNADVINAINTTIKTLAEVALTREMIDRQLADSNEYD